MGAIGISPGDEVIVPPTTMSATAMCPIIYGGIPVFADIEEDTFCLCLNSVKKNLTKKTKAIIAVNLFGHPARLHELRKLADEKGIFLIEDNAQSIIAKENQKYTGTIGHIGVFSLNYHKHIHTGEGGMCCTNDDNLAERLQLIRNHAEAVVEDANVSNLVNMIGFNYRMTEMSAALGIVQLKNVKKHVKKRLKFARSLNNKLNNLTGIELPKTRINCTHSYYNWMIKFNKEVLGVDRDIFVKALQAEGVPCFSGYLKPLYHLPVFQKKIAIGHKNFPFNLTKRNYHNNLCPVAEKLYQEKFIGLEICAWEMNTKLVEQLIQAFYKVYDNLNDLKSVI